MAAEIEPREPTVPPREMRGWARLCVIVGAIVFAFALVLCTGVGGPEVAQTVSNFGLAAGAIFAAIACLRRARSFTGRMRRGRMHGGRMHGGRMHGGRMHGGRMRWGWTVVGLGVLSWGLGQVVWIYLETFLGEDAPFPSPADIGYLGMVVLTPIGLLILPSAAKALASRSRSVLDGLMVATSLILIASTFVIEPLVAAGQDTQLALFISLAYPLGDVVIVTIVVYMLAQQRRSGLAFSRLALVGAGVVAFAGSDIGYAFLNLVGKYQSGGITDVGWFLGFALILLAAGKPVPPPGDQPVANAGRGQPVGILLPYVAVLGALIATVAWYARTGHSTLFVAYTRSVLILLIIGRQLLTLRENRDLTRTLEARVADRTAELFASERRFHALVQHSSDVVTVVSPDADVLYQSESVLRVFGYSAPALTGRRLTKLLDPESAMRLVQALLQVAGRPYATTVLELTVRHRDGRIRQAEMTITNLLGDTSVGGLVLNTRDISERKELQDQLVHEAYHDALTQLANRALFRERLADALRRREADGEVTVLFLDLDGFKEVNDSLGHLVGDQLLVQVADRLRAAVRAGDLVARFGGDEFAILVESPPAGSESGGSESGGSESGGSESGGGDAELVAQRIVDMLQEPFAGGSRDIHVPASIGLASAALLADPQADGAEQLMRNADLAMYKAKSAGGSSYASYDPQMLAGLGSA